MIKFALICAKKHDFEAWFQSGGAYETQVARGQVLCPHCGSHEVDKAVMAPAIATRRTREPALQPQSEKPTIPAQELVHLMRKMREEVHANAEYVGGRFAEEARRIHLDESPARGIYGEASADEVKGLAEDGIPVFPMPRLPEDLN